MSTTIARPVCAFFALLAAAIPLSSSCGDSSRSLAPVAPAVVPPTPITPPAVPAFTGTEYIYLAEPNGSITARLTRGDWPAWSPDGKRIAFQWSGDVHVMNADGSNDVALAAGGSPAWSPDGRRIVFTDGIGISVMNADGTDIRNLIRHGFRTDTYKPWDMGVGRPAWSPDGTRIAFQHFGDGDMVPGQVFVMNADGSTPHLLTTLVSGAQYAESDPSWSPNGSKITYWSFGYGIAVVDVIDGMPKALYENFPTVAFGAKPVWSPDGATILFNSSQLRPHAAAILRMSSAGGAPTVLIPDAYHPAWSPDGSSIAFVSAR